MKRGQEHRVSITELRKGWSHWFARASRGERIVICRRGTPVAVLEACETVSRARKEKALREILAIGKGRSLGGTSLREVLEEGRR
jgi:prevent-host-death family protein